MKQRSALNKAIRLENWLVEKCRELIDVKTFKTSASGAGLDKNDVRIPNFDIEIEAKNQGVWHMPEYVEQLKRQKTNGNTSVLEVRNPAKPEFEEVFIIMDFYDWAELVKRQNSNVEVESNFDPKLKWKVKKLQEAARDVFKELESYK
jgi:hypothetical protein